jgi:ABC-type uncharacterized transport system substrate-binding protein
LWRPVFKKIATLQEIETHWSVDDLADAHELMDYQEHLEAQEAQKMQASRKLR